MEGGATTARSTTLRTLLALIMLAALLGAVPAVAGTKDQLDAAKAELARVQAQLDRATAKWQAAELALDNTQAEIALTRDRIGGLESRLDNISARLNRRATIAFTTGPARPIDLFRSSGPFTEFPDRVEFLGAVARNDRTDSEGRGGGCTARGTDCREDAVVCGRRRTRLTNGPGL